MKKQIIILFLLIIHFSSWSQNVIKTSTPCNDEVLYKTPGKWFKYTDVWQTDHIGFNAAQQKEVSNRVDKIHSLMQSIYPAPMGLDVAWRRSLGYSTFAEQVRYELNSEGNPEAIVLKEKPVAVWGYTCGFFRHYCNYNNANELILGYPGETGTWVDVYVNNYRQATAVAQQLYEGIFTINGYPIHLRQPLNKKLGEFEILGTPSTGFSRYIIVHRKGMLPYIPVTRKQYLEQCIPYLTQYFSDVIKDADKMPSATQDERAYRDEVKKKTIEERDNVLKRYKDELEKTIKEGLQDKPAIVKRIADSQLYDELIFVDETEGWMLVIHNPEYMRIDLPKHVPQFFTVAWRWNDWPPQAEIAKLMEEKFPFEKLQAMIDK